MGRTEARYSISATDETKAAIRSVQNGLKGLTGQFKGISRIATTAFAAIGGTALVKGIVDASIEQEDALRQLEQRIKSTGGVAGLSVQDFEKMAGGLQRVTTFSDEAILSMGGVLLSFTNIRGQQVEGATKAILDVATALGKDLNSAAMQVGKALNDPVNGLSTLSKAGIQFSQDQQSVIKALMETGDTAAAQNIILDELKTRFGGAAEAAADTFRGSIQQLKNAFGDLLESKGGLNDAKTSIQQLTALLSDPATQENAQKLVGALISGFNGATRAVSEFVDMADLIGAYAAILNLQVGDGFFERLNAIIEARKEARAKLDDLNKSEQSLNENEKEIAAERAARMKQEAEARDAAAAALRAEADARAKQDEAERSTEQRRKAAVAAAAAQAKQEQSAILGMQQQIALIGEASERERVLAEIRFGSYRGFSAATQRRLLELAQEKDAEISAREAADAAFRAMEENKKLRDEAEQKRQAQMETEQSAIRGLQEQIALVGALTNEERALVSVRLGAYSEYSAANQTRLVELSRELDAAQKAAEKTQDTLSVFAEEAGRNLQNILASHFENGFAGIKQSFADMLKSMIAQAAAAQLLQHLGGWGKSNAGAGGFTGGLASIAQLMFGGTRDSGGRGYPGMAYAIGTGAQPEVFVPDTPGTFYPRGRDMQPGGGGGVTVNQTLPRGSSAETRRAAAAGLRDAMNLVNRAARYS